MNVDGGIGLRIAAQGAWNMMRNKPLSLSFEVTHSCTANCWHCNWGGAIKETRLDPEGYARLWRTMRAPIVNVSGGEPLARGDLDQVVRALANPGKLPWVVVVTNASQLSGDRFLRLKEAGMHQLSVSIDFPDDRHSTFRRIPGLFDRMDRVIPECARLGEPGDVSLNCCITSWNFRDLPAIVELAERWGVSVNFSAYSQLRVEEPEGLVKKNGSKEELRGIIEHLIELKRLGKPVYTSESAFWSYYKFLCEGHIGGCMAGSRFLVVNPDGRLTPCAMVMAYFDDQKTMHKEFTCKNTCGACYISTRANAEKTAADFIRSNRDSLARMLPWNWRPAAR